MAAAYRWLSAPEWKRRIDERKLPDAICQFATAARAGQIAAATFSAVSLHPSHYIGLRLPAASV